LIVEQLTRSTVVNHQGATGGNCSISGNNGEVTTGAEAITSDALECRKGGFVEHNFVGASGKVGDLIDAYSTTGEDSVSVVQELIGSCTTCERIVARLPNKEIVTSATDENINSRPPCKRIVACATVKGDSP
jgi:orotate phosphoribosyltransferase-like protein